MVVMSKNMAIRRLSFRWELARPPEVTAAGAAAAGLAAAGLGAATRSSSCLGPPSSSATGVSRSFDSFSNSKTSVVCFLVSSVISKSSFFRLEMGLPILSFTLTLTMISRVSLVKVTCAGTSWNATKVNARASSLYFFIEEASHPEANGSTDGSHAAHTLQHANCIRSDRRAKRRRNRVVENIVRVDLNFQGLALLERKGARHVQIHGEGVRTWNGIPAGVAE